MWKKNSKTIEFLHHFYDMDFIYWPRVRRVLSSKDYNRTESSIANNCYQYFNVKPLKKMLLCNYLTLTTQ